MLKKNIFIITAFVTLGFIIGCAPSLYGVVKMPNGDNINGREVTVWTKPHTSTVKADKNGKFKLSGVHKKNEYTLFAEDNEGAQGILYKCRYEKGKKVLVKLSKEMTAGEAAMEGGINDTGGGGAGETTLTISP